MSEARLERMYAVQIGRVVRMMRSRLKMSQEALAHRAGLHRTYVGAVERGERNVTIVSLRRIAEALGVSPAVLLHEAESFARDARKGTG